MTVHLDVRSYIERPRAMAKASSRGMAVSLPTRAFSRLLSIERIWSRVRRRPLRCGGTPIAGLSRVLSWQILRARVEFAQELFKVIRTEAAIARRETGKGIWSQLTEIIRLRRGVGRLEPDEVLPLPPL